MPTSIGGIDIKYGLGLRIPEVYVTRWLEKHKISADKIERGNPVWPVRFADAVPGGIGRARVDRGEIRRNKIPLSWTDIERMIAFDDPVIWGWLNLIERKTLTIDNVQAVTAGAPWALFPIQAQMARIDGDLIVECGSEVGKTRDIVLRCLWRCDTGENRSMMIGGDSDQTLIPIWEEIEYQIEENIRIGGGVNEAKCHQKPNRKKVFRNGSEIELRLCGHDGKNFRGGHFSDGIYADEAVKWKNRQQWSEFWRAGLPGSFARVYSTPDGDYSCPFRAMAARAIPINSSRGFFEQPEPSDATMPEPTSGEKRFRKFHISKKDLPSPFWSEARAAAYRERYNGEHSVEWITNVDGGWGSPSYSVFPMSSLRPCLKVLPDYRMVRVTVDRDNQNVSIAAARLNPEAEDTENAAPNEIMLERDTVAKEPNGARALGAVIAGFWPPAARDWVTPILVCGADLGSAQDPSEFLFQRIVGDIWSDVFRLHLRSADWTEQADIVIALDHAALHRASYSFDSGSAGTALVQALTQGRDARACYLCPDGNRLHLSERLVGRGFGERVDEFDIKTGLTVPNPDDKDKEGTPRPYRVSNKEFGTRILERKIASRELEIALDGGAGDQRLSGPQLLVNHTASGVTKRGERNFRGQDDHHIDARRQAALAAVADKRRDGFVTPRTEDLVRLGTSRPLPAGGVRLQPISAALGGAGRISRKW